MCCIANGVALPGGEKDHSDKINCLVTTVRLDYQKGIDILLKAWERVVADQHNLQLLVLGKGPHEKEFKELSQSLGISHSVRFMGEVHNVEDYLRRADGFVLASRAEGMSNALLEAMAHGLPCVVTNISGNVELMGIEPGRKIPAGEYIISEYGLVVSPEDVDGLARAILFLLRNRALRETIGRNARINVQKNYSIDRIAGRYIHLYRQLMA